MKPHATIAAFGLLFLASSGWAQTTRPALGPRVTATTRPAPTTAPSADPATKKILDAMEAAGKKVKTILADLTYESINTSLGDREYRTGWVAYRSKQTFKSGTKEITIPPMFRVHFETVRLGKGKTTKDPVDYAYDGKILTIARARTKTITRFQLPPERNAGDMMQLGKGPMPLPFGQKTADMIRFFKCTNRPSRSSDPKDTVYLSLVTRDIHKKDLSTIYIHMWVSTKTHLPVKIKTRDKTKNIITTAFSKTVINEALKQSVFTISKPFGWKIIIQPLRQGQNLKP